MSAGWAAAAQGIAQVGGSIFSGISNAVGQRRQFKRQLQLQQNEFDFNRQMWNEQNAYNTPSAQMARLQEAGLNPRLIYGNGSTATGQASSAPQYSAPTAPNYASAFNEASFVALDAISNLLSRNESLKSQRLDNAIKQVDLENYIDHEETFLDYISLDEFGNPTVGVSRRPGIGSLKRSHALESLEAIRQSNRGTELENAYREIRNDYQPSLFRSEIDLRKATRDNTLTQKLQRDLQNRILDLEYRWFNSSKFMRNLAPLLRLIKAR